MKRWICFCLALMMLFSAGCAESSADSVIDQLLVDFSKRAGVPLIKKFGLFNSGLVSLEQYDRDLHLMDELRVDSLRIDLFAGEPLQPMGKMVTGTADNLQYDFSALDRIIARLQEHGSRLYASWCYIPLPLQVNGNWRSGPTDLKAWQEIYRQYAAYYVEKGIAVSFLTLNLQCKCNREKRR